MNEEQNIIPENLDDNSCSAMQWEAMKNEILTAVDEKFDVEAVAQVVEQLDFSKKVDAKIAQSACNRNCREGQNAGNISCIQSELRDLIMDVTLLKRALMSLGQPGVMERRRIEKELILELFPPRQVRPGLGVTIAQGQSSAVNEEDCEARVHLCKQACCRIFDVHLNAGEVESGRFDWNPRSPYSLHKNHMGCIHLVEGKCSMYHNRPATCFTYSCKKDSRIWKDYEKMILSPSLKQRLISSNLLAKDSDESSKNPNCDPKNNLIASPDFSKLREMTVAEPTNQFVPPPKPEQESEPT
jgi:Fe-S-cluster containining protein